MLISYIVTLDTETGEATIKSLNKDPLGLFHTAKGKKDTSFTHNEMATKTCDIAKKREIGAQFVVLWNKICVPVGLKKVVALSDKRAVHCYERADEMRKLGRPAPDVFEQVCEKVAASKFLRGEAGSNPKNGHTFACTFDWLTQYVGNWLKVFEGNYDDENKPNSLNVNALWQ